MSMVNEWQHLKIPFDEIKVATQNFKTLLGRGGYGLVFKGKLLVSGKETMVAVKRLNEQHGQGLKEFLTEIQLLCGQQHPNLISLVGYCDEGREKSIVYEYAERGSLDQHIRRTRKTTSTTLTWLQRLKICTDAARGLDHLHSHVGGHRTIIHRDIKSSNILIDENWVGKISDLGLSKLSVTGFGMSDIVSNSCGTHGYCEPEYYTSGIVTKKSDVYSFGVVLFEVLCGRLCLTESDDGFRLSSISAKEFYRNNTLDKIIDQSLSEHIGSYSMTKFAEIAYRCLDDDRKQRPAMDVVVKELEEALKYQEEYEFENEWQRLKIPFDEIKVATENFKTIIGQGGYGSVFKGKLFVSGKETTVAIKWLNEQFGQGLMEFSTEIQLLYFGQHHPNLISLVGYCDEGKKKAIVYEYAEHGSLDQYIRHSGKGTSPTTTLTWLQRLKICVDAARGLDHLHSNVGGHQTIIHRDVKSSNILIDENWVGKISDLGLPKLSVTDFGMIDIVSNGYGTQGYCEPEYNSTGVVTKKSDVYSFGVVLFEVLCGRLCLTENEDGFRLSSISAKYHYKKNSLSKIMDDTLREHMDSYSMIKFVEIAYRCLHDDREQRPAMDVVVKELEEALKYQEYEFQKEDDTDEYRETKLRRDLEEARKYQVETMSERVEGTTIGIDLGMTYSCAAIWSRKYNRVQIIPNDQGNTNTPSYVSFSDSELFVGEGAKNRIAINPTNTVFDFKRLIGSKFSDHRVQKDMELWPFKFVKADYGGYPSVVVEYEGRERKFSPEELSSFVLKKMKEAAEAFLGEEVKNAVITVPAYFNNQQREATKKAGNLAGLNVVCLLNEPTAAAIAYGVDNVAGKKWNKDNKSVFVFDLGPKTFDVSLLTISKTGVIDVKAVGGDTHFGGEDFNATLINYCITEFKKKHKYFVDIRGDINPRALGRLKVACEKARKDLSSKSQAFIFIECFYQGIDFSITISRSKFEELNSTYFKKCIKLLEKCLHDGDMAKKNVDEVVLVGGSSGIPNVQRMLEEFFDGKTLCNSLNGDEAIASGAAIMAARLSGDI